MNHEAMNYEALQRQIQEMRQQLENRERDIPEDKLSLIVFSGDLDKVMASLVIATGAAGMGMDSQMFFTFWGTPALRDPKKRSGAKDFMGRMFGFLLPKGLSELKLSKLNMGGMGTSMMQSLMRKKNVSTLPQLLDMAAEAEVKIYICQMSMDLMGFKPEEMIDYPHLDYAGVATFLQRSSDAKISMFI
jgi:peroxiredoxin family protein